MASTSQRAVTSTWGWDEMALRSSIPMFPTPICAARSLVWALPPFKREGAKRIPRAPTPLFLIKSRLFICLIWGLKFFDLDVSKPDWAGMVLKRNIAGAVLPIVGAGLPFVRALLFFPGLVPGHKGQQQFPVQPMLHPFRGEDELGAVPLPERLEDLVGPGGCMA